MKKKPIDFIVLAIAGAVVTAAFSSAGYFVAAMWEMNR